MRHSNYIGVFYALLQAGLWEKDVQLLRYGWVDYKKVMQLAEEQSVVGLVTAGLEHVVDTKVPHGSLVPFIGRTLQIEQRNKAMNEFIAKLMNLLNENGVKALLVKGQGVAQCYERPLWRVCGDVDLLLDDENYRKAKELLIPLASSVEPEEKSKLHLGMTINSWIVELHGTMHTVISHKINRVIDDVQKDIFVHAGVRIWNNNVVDIFLPNPDNDVIIIFTHFINHFYGEGIGLRQVCDWCRLLWIYRYEIDVKKLESRIRKAGLMSEWKAFAVFLVKYLGMPEHIVPLYTYTSSLNKKAERICRLIIETGNFGHNKDFSYKKKSSKFKGNIITFWRRFKEFANISKIFPINAPKFFVTYVLGRLKALM